VQGVLQRLANQFQAIQQADRRQHGGRGGPLPPACPHQPRLPAARQQQVEEYCLLLAGQQPGAELAQHRGVEARVIQRQTEDVFPVDARPHRVGGLDVREPLGELQDSDQGQLGGGDRRAAARREQGSERAVLENRPQFVAQGEIRMAFREGGACDAGRLLGNQGDGERLQGHGEPPPECRQSPRPGGGDHGAYRTTQAAASLLHRHEAAQPQFASGIALDTDGEVSTT
jgi:hypothetical protein